MAKQTTKAGATVTITKAAPTATKGKTKASPLPSVNNAFTVVPVAPAAPVAPTVALRGGPAVASVHMTGKVYRTKAAHNLEWWAALQKATATGPASVTTVLENKVPSHFVGYCIRRGYLQAA